MTYHVVAYAKSILTKGTLQAITPVPDPTVTENVNDILVPDKFNKVLAVASLTKGSQVFTRANIQSPSLREFIFPDITPLRLGSTFDTITYIWTPGASPLELKTNEGLEYFSDGGGDGVTAQLTYGVVFLGDSKITPVSGNAFTVRATSAIVQAGQAWTNGAITFDESLPVGNYDIIGMRAQGTGLVAARLVFIGASAITRPGVPGLLNEQSIELTQFRFGEPGLLGSFSSTTPPSVEVLGDTGTAQQYYFDLVRR